MIEIIIAAVVSCATVFAVTGLVLLALLAFFAFPIGVKIDEFMVRRENKRRGF